MKQHFISLEENYYARTERELELMREEIYYEANVSYVEGSAEEKRVIQSYTNRLHGLTKEILSWENVKPELISVFRGRYQIDELKKLVEFLESNIGQKYVTSEREISKQVNSIEGNRKDKWGVIAYKLTSKMREEVIETIRSEN